MQVIYLIYVELGWDNVVGIFTDTPENRECLTKYCKENYGYVQCSQKVKENAEGWLE